MIQTLTVETSKVGKSGLTKKGNTWTQVSILSGGKWYGGTAWNDDELNRIKNLKKGDKVVVMTYQEDYNGKAYDKFKFPSERDQMQADIDKLKDTINNLIKLNNLKYK